MSLEKAHQRSLQERPHHPDEPQPVKWTGRRAKDWNAAYHDYDSLFRWRAHAGEHRKPWGRHAAPWTLQRAEADDNSRTPEWSAAA